MALLLLQMGRYVPTTRNRKLKFTLTEGMLTAYVDLNGTKT